MNYWEIASILLLIPLYPILAVQVLSNEEDQNIATWISWALLDGEVAFFLFLQGGNWTLPFGFSLGSIVIVSCLVKKNIFKWTWVETVALVIVGICLTIYFFVDPITAIVVTTTGVIFGTIPQIKDAWKDAEKSPILCYIGFGTSCFLSTIGGADWSVEGRLYSTVCGVLCSIIVVVSITRSWDSVKKSLKSLVF